MKSLEIRNPYSGVLLATVPFTEPEYLSTVLERSVRAQSQWKTSLAWERAQLLTSAAFQLEGQKEDFATLICQEAGKPIQLARGEVDRAVGVLRWASGEAQRFAGEVLRLDAGATGRTGFGIHSRFPRGVILGITPFNFPLNLVVHKIAPALACGCTILIKPSPFTPLTAIKLAEIFEKLSPGLVQVITPHDSAAATLTQAPEVAMISFTGSARVGWMIRKQAPEKPTALELGGNAWVIVMEDTPREAFPTIVKKITGAAYGYAGQSCISVQNAAIARCHWTELQKMLSEVTQATSFGDPALESVISGPVINQAAADRVRIQIEGVSSSPSSPVHISVSKKEEGRTGESNLISPTLVSFSQSQALETPLVQEEIFAPVMTAQPFESLPGLIQQINSSRYGLQTGVYTQNWPTIEKLYQELHVGGLIVNDVPTTRYDHQPYGGVKDSGQGREGIKYAMEEMTEGKFLALSSEIPLFSKPR